jgi:hypothetical protein
VIASLRRWSRAWCFELGVGAAVGVALMAVGYRTAGDVDEGFYLLAGELVARGRLPYRDFFYPQAPYLPFLTAPLALLGPTFTSARMLFAALGGATGGLVAALVRRDTGSRAVALAAALLYAMNEVTWQWTPSVRPYAPAALLSMVCLGLLTAPSPPRLRGAFLAGLLSGVAAGMRLLLLPLVVASVAGAWLRGAAFARVRALLLLVLLRAFLWAPYGAQGRLARWMLPLGLAVVAVGPGWWPRAQRGLSAALGAVTAALPAYVIYRLAPQGFFFGNLTFHAARVPGAAPEDPAALTARGVSAASMLGLAPVQQVSALGVEVALLTLFAAVAALLGRSRAVTAPLLAAGGIALAAMVPTPMHEHYLTPMIPALAVLAGLGLGALADARGDVTRRHALPAAMVALTLALGQASFRQKWVHGAFGMVGEFRLAHFRPRLLDASAAWTRWVSDRHPGPVLALWPGSAVGVADRLLRGTENHFARTAPLPPGDLDTAERLRVVTGVGMRALVMNRVPAVVTFDREAEHEGAEAFHALLERCGYRPRGGVAHVSVVFARVEPPAADCLPRGR